MIRSIIAIAVFLTACETNGQRLESYGNTCRDYGHHAGTAAYATCIENIDQQRRGRVSSSIIDSIFNPNH